MTTDHISSATSRPWQAALVYALMGTVWIVLSDWAVDKAFPDEGDQLLAQTVKGLLFIGATTLLVYVLAKRAVDERERDLLADRLSTTQNLLERILASLGEAVLVVDPESREISECNTAVERMLGYRVDELVGQSTRVLHVD